MLYLSVTLLNSKFLHRWMHALQLSGEHLLSVVPTFARHRPISSLSVLILEMCMCIVVGYSQMCCLTFQQPYTVCNFGTLDNKPILSFRYEDVLQQWTIIYSYCIDEAGVMLKLIFLFKKKQYFNSFDIL